MQNNFRYLIGIDLGTTHCAMAYADTREASPIPRLFPIDQLVAPGEVARLPLFASCRYHPHPEEYRPEDLALPWSRGDDGLPEPVAPLIQGALARQLSGKTLGRSVTSAKSWLSHSQVDREAEILPWGADPEVSKVSPVMATAGYLRYLRQCWDWHHPDHPLKDQYLILTVPASFGEDARQLTLQAAEIAGVPVARLLEEPTAAFYAWFWEHREHFARMQGEKRVLVCDVGGGTSDFTLLKVTGRPGEVPAVERVSVGDHLLLGGDNMDLAIAWQAEASMGGRLSPQGLLQLAEESRRAKEACLSDQAPDELSITLLGSGSKLIGGARTARLETSRIRSFLLDSFFPRLDWNADLTRMSAALVEAGLPYEKDAAITRHILRFLRQDVPRQPESAAPGFPDAVLFNGGPFNSALLRRHLMEIFEGWRSGPVEELTIASADTAVATGAVVHGLALQGLFARVGGGSARHYYLLTETEAGEPAGVCLLPKGTPEAVRQTLDNRRFRLTTGALVSFRVATSRADAPRTLGEVQAPAEDWHPLPPLVVKLGTEEAAAEVEVRLTAELTEVGVLQLRCEDVANPANVWRLEFQTRGATSPQPVESQQRSHPKLAEALDALQAYFQAAKQDSQGFKQLRAGLEQQLGEREQWALVDIRAMADLLLGMADSRKRSPWYERAWLHWIGFCARPGKGHPADPERQQQLAEIYRRGVHHASEQAVWAEWWNMWRRVSAGLSVEIQQALLEDIAYYLHPSNTRSRKRQAELAQRAYDDMVRLLGSLEELSVAQKQEAGNWLMERLRKPGESPHTWWALGRLGARLPFSSSLDKVLPPDSVQPWLDELLKVDWRKQKVAALAATLIARKTGDRALDLDEELREQLCARLRQAKASERWIELVRNVVELDQEDQGSLFGESLPAGLVLVEG